MSYGRKGRNQKIAGRGAQWLGAAMLAGVSLTAMPLMAQEQGSYPPPADPPQYQQAPQQAPQYQAAPNYQQPPNYQQAPPNYQQTQPPYQPVPQALTIPAGTVIAVRNSGFLSSDQNRAGDSFGLTLDQPLIVNGWVVARRGQPAYGRVSQAEKSKAGGGNSRLGIEMSEITLVDGQQMPIQTQLSEATGEGVSSGQQLATVGITSGMGAAIGAAADGGMGAGIGAVAGAAAGMIGVMFQHGKPTVIPPETLLSFRLTAPVTISTVHSQVAFQPASQQDYNMNYDRYRGTAAAYPPGPQRIVTPAPFYEPYPYYGPYYYPAPYYYGGFYGPSFVFRFGDRGRFFDRGRFEGRFRR